MTCDVWVVIVYWVFLNSPPVVPMFSGISEDVLRDHYDMMSLDLGFFGGGSDDEF